MDPKPLQEPGRRLFMGYAALGAKRAHAFGDGFYPVFDPFADLHRHADLQDIPGEELSVWPSQ